jgi:antitoxin PrlF
MHLLGVIALSKMSVKAQTVLPKPVREKLGLRPGDTVRFVIEEDRVTIARHVATEDDPFHAFTEWASPEDDEAYASL